MRIVVGANHRGYLRRMMVVEIVQQLGHQVIDVGTHEAKIVDYPDIAARVAEEIVSGAADRGILLGGVGVGMCIAANKFPGIRAVLCHQEMLAETSRRCIDANVLCLSAALLGGPLMRHIVETWLQSPFEGGRHERRVQKIASIEERIAGVR
jgi:ribose 5-phosphate isomerase B